MVWSLVRFHLGSTCWIVCRPTFREHDHVLRTSSRDLTVSLLLLQSSEELKGLLERALMKQKEALVAHWGENVDEEGKIDRYRVIPSTGSFKNSRWLPHLYELRAHK